MIDKDFFQLFTILVEDGERFATAIDEASREDSVDVSHDELSIHQGSMRQGLVSATNHNMIRSACLVDALHFMQIAFGEHNALEYGHVTM